MQPTRTSRSSGETENITVSGRLNVASYAVSPSFMFDVFQIIVTYVASIVALFASPATGLKERFERSLSADLFSHSRKHGSTISRGAIVRDRAPLATR